MRCAMLSCSSSQAGQSPSAQRPKGCGDTGCPDPRVSELVPSQWQDLSHPPSSSWRCPPLAELHFGAEVHLRGTNTEGLDWLSPSALVMERSGPGQVWVLTEGRRCSLLLWTTASWTDGKKQCLVMVELKKLPRSNWARTGTVWWEKHTKLWH